MVFYSDVFYLSPEFSDDNFNLDFACILYMSSKMVEVGTFPPIYWYSQRLSSQQGTNKELLKYNFTVRDKCNYNF